MAQKAHDPIAAQPQFFLGFFCGADKTRHENIKTYAALGMGLRIEKRLDAHDMVSGYALEIAPGQVEKVLLGTQDIAARVIQIQKRLQIGKGIGLAQRLDIGIGQLHAIALCQCENQFRL